MFNICTNRILRANEYRENPKEKKSIIDEILSDFFVFFFQIFPEFWMKNGVGAQENCKLVFLSKRWSQWWVMASGVWVTMTSTHKHTMERNSFFYFLDPRLRDCLFMSNPFYMFAILAVYLLFVLKWGPQFMKNRKSFDLNRIMIVYNIIQIIACARLVMQASIYLLNSNRNELNWLFAAFIFICRDCSMSTNSTVVTVFYANQSILAWIK